MSIETRVFLHTWSAAFNAVTVYLLLCLATA